MSSSAPGACAPSGRAAPASSPPAPLLSTSHYSKPKPKPNRWSDMTKRRSRGDGGLYWSESRQRWMGEITIGYDGRGKRITRKASAKTKTEARDKLKEMIRVNGQVAVPGGGQLKVPT